MIAGIAFIVFVGGLVVMHYLASTKKTRLGRYLAGEDLKERP